MSNGLKALVVVEGEKSEKAFFDSMNNCLGLSFQICPFKANVYELWYKMKESDFTLNINEALIEKYPDEKDLLSCEYAYYYLVFDMDPQHRSTNDKSDLISLAHKNIATLKDVTKYCVDETDPTVGKVYINYPMFESYRCCDCFGDESYKDEFIKIEDVKQFKNYCSSKRIAGVQLTNYKDENFFSLIKYNIFKLGVLYNSEWGCCSYDDYLLRSNQTSVLNMEEQFMNNDYQIAVINTSLFLVIDYYGNNNGYFDHIMNDV